ncbi:MAG TPA: hypothetical protein DDW54_01080 [Clostridiales bacterium]|nr:hypothetical protein [Clostridiales bacterium]
MSENSGNIMTVIDEDGTERDMEILFTYHSEEYGKDYVVFFTDDKEEDISAAVYTEKDDNGGELSEIESDEEWAMLDKVLEEYLEGEDEDEQ